MLRGRDTTTIADLAMELGVSRRTVLRDLATLRDRGMAIAGEAGPGGGIRLDAAHGLTAVHLSLAEIIAIWLGARLARAASDLPWGAAAVSGLAKLLASLPRRRARDLRALCRRVLVGPPASAAVRSAAGAPAPQLLTVFEEAFSGGFGLAFVYTDRAGAVSPRHVAPHGLLVEPPVWYILGFDLDKQKPRTFRMDRISRPRVLRDVVFRPDLGVIRDQLPQSERWQPLSGRWLV